MRQTTRENLFRLADLFLLPVLILVVVFFCFTSITSIFSLPGSFTLSRGGLLVIPVMIAVGCCFLVFSMIPNQSRLSRWLNPLIDNPRTRRIIEIILPTGWLVLITVSFLPPASLNGWIAIYQRLSPILLLLFVFDTCLWIYWLYLTHRLKVADSEEQNLLSGKAGLSLGLIIALIWVVIALTGKGVGSGTQYWGKTGVPIINWQLGVSWLIVFTGIHIWGSRYGWLSRYKDLLLFCLLWLSAFLVWQSVPVSASRYTTTTYPPNYTNYPYSDAGDYALQAELILSGHGFTEGFVDKPLHLTFLACLNWLAGSNFSRMILYQKALLAVIPALVFLLCLRLSNRPAGVLSGLLVLFIQANNLAIAPNIQSTNVSMTMSEPWTAFMLLLCCITLVTWWKDPEGSLWFPALAGGVMGLAVLVRLNMVALFFLVIIVWIFFSGIKKRKTWMSLLVLCLFFTGTLVPWGIRNQVVFDDAFKSYMSKARGVIFKNRIKPVLNESTDSGLQISSPTGSFASPEQKTTTLSETETNFPNRHTVLIDQMLHTGFHNLVTVGMALPVSPYHTDLDQTIRLRYWDQEWDGQLEKDGWIILSISLLMLVVGFSRAWKYTRMASLVPGLVLVSYLGTNTISLVSGGRYIVPIDWVLPLYYAIGLWTVSTWLMGNGHVDNPQNPLVSPSGVTATRARNFQAGAMILIIVFACLPAVLGLIPPVDGKNLTKIQVLETMEASGVDLPGNLTWNALEDFAKYDDSSFMLVKVMFPRWMKTGAGDTGGRGSAFSPLPFDHLSFVGIDENGNQLDVILPINEQITYLPDASEVYVVGCAGENYFDSVFLTIVGKEKITYSRPGITSLICPLPIP